MAAPMSENKEEEFSGIYSGMYPVIELTLSFLSWKQLCRVARVCKVWRNIVNKEKNRRQTKSFTCLHPTIEDIANGTAEFFEGMYTRPDVVFMFCSIGVLCQPVPSLKTNFWKFVASLLPPDCTLIGTDSAGIVGTSADLQTIEEIENSDSVSFLCLPKYNGTDRLEIRCHANDYNSDKVPTIQQIPNQVSNQQNQAMVYLNSGTPVGNLINYKLFDRQPARALGGAFVEEVLANITDQNKEIGSFIVSFYGNNVKAASILIPQNVNTQQGAEERIKKLKDQNLPEKNSFAFMFACLGRGEGLYGEQNVESAIFKKYFPQTPLIGVFGNGEFGCDSIEASKEIEYPERKRRRRHAKLCHSYTTVLMLVAIT